MRQTPIVTIMDFKNNHDNDDGHDIERKLKITEKKCNLPVS